MSLAIGNQLAIKRVLLEGIEKTVHRASRAPVTLFLYFLGCKETVFGYFFCSFNGDYLLTEMRLNSSHALVSAEHWGQKFSITAPLCVSGLKSAAYPVLLNYFYIVRTFQLFTIQVQ